MNCTGKPKNKRQDQIDDKMSAESVHQKYTQWGNQYADNNDD